MNKIHKQIQDSKHFLKEVAKRVLGHKEPFLCIITAVFDPALDSLRHLVKDLQDQADGDFMHIMVSNGPSPKVKSFVEDIRKTDRRFGYDEMVYDSIYERTGEYNDLVANIGRRRGYVMKKYNAQRYINLAADFQIIEKAFIRRLKEEHFKTGKDIILVKVNAYGSEFPHFPLKYGFIDLSNYTYSKKIAKKYPYPNDHPRPGESGNDYRYFETIFNMSFIEDIVVGNKDANPSYKNLTDIHSEQVKNKS